MLPANQNAHFTEFRDLMGGDWAARLDAEVSLELSGAATRVRLIDLSRSGAGLKGAVGKPGDRIALAIGGRTIHGAVAAVKPDGTGVRFNDALPLDELNTLALGLSAQAA